jgi:hypothetical protein
MFLFVNYCSDMFRPHLLAIFRERVSFSTCAAYSLITWTLGNCNLIRVDPQLATSQQLKVYATHTKNC